MQHQKIDWSFDFDKKGHPSKFGRGTGCLYSNKYGTFKQCNRYKTRDLFTTVQSEILTNPYAFNCANIRSISSSASVFLSFPPIAPEAVGASRT